MPKSKEKQEGLFVRTAKFKVGVIDFFSPLGMAMLRVWIALIFWNSGLTKVSNMDSAIFLFEEEYKTHEKLTFFGHQIFTPEMAAYLAASVEILFPILLVIGLYTRGAAAFLLVLTAIIELTYQSSPQHIIWSIILGAIFFNGPHRFSWDYFIRANYVGFSKDDSEYDKLLATFGTLCMTLYASYLVFDGFIK